MAMIYKNYRFWPAGFVREAEVRGRRLCGTKVSFFAEPDSLFAFPSVAPLYRRQDVCDEPRQRQGDQPRRHVRAQRPLCASVGGVKRRAHLSPSINTTTQLLRGTTREWQCEAIVAPSKWVHVAYVKMGDMKNNYAQVGR